MFLLIGAAEVSRPLSAILPYR